MEHLSPHHDDFENDENPPVIDFDFQSGTFNLLSIHPSLKKIFKSLGVTKKDLKDKRMVPVIFDCVIRAFSELHIDGTTEEMKKKTVKKSFDLIEEAYSDDKTPKVKETPCVIKFDLKLGVFEIENLHPTLKRIFRKAKITKKDLRNKTMAIAILRAIIESFCETHDLVESKQMMENSNLLKL